MAFCTNCGAELTGSFCTQCGEPSGDVSRRRRNTRRLTMWVFIAFGILIAFVTAMGVQWARNNTYDRHTGGDLRSEAALVQSATYAMMAENRLSLVDGHTTGPAVNEWSSQPTGAGAASLYSYLKKYSYLEKSTTTFYYCWTAEGDVYPRSNDSSLAGTPGECPPPPWDS